MVDSLTSYQCGKSSIPSVAMWDGMWSPGRTSRLSLDSPVSFHSNVTESPPSVPTREFWKVVTTRISIVVKRIKQCVFLFVRRLWSWTRKKKKTTKHGTRARAFRHTHARACTHNHTHAHTHRIHILNSLLITSELIDWDEVLTATPTKCTYAKLSLDIFLSFEGTSEKTFCPCLNRSALRKLSFLSLNHEHLFCL